jgi:hypothetical protein
MLFVTKTFSITYENPPKKVKNLKVTCFSSLDAIEVMGVFTIKQTGVIRCPKKQPVCVTIHPDLGDDIKLKGYHPDSQEEIFNVLISDFSIELENDDDEIIIFTEIE